MLARHHEVDVEARKPIFDRLDDDLEIETLTVFGDGLDELLLGCAAELTELVSAQHCHHLGDVVATHLVELTDLVAPDAQRVHHHDGAETLEQVVDIDALAVGENFGADHLGVEAAHAQGLILGHCFDDFSDGHIELDPLLTTSLEGRRYPALALGVFLEVASCDRYEFLDLHHEKLARPIVIETSEFFEFMFAVGDARCGERAVVDQADRQEALGNAVPSCLRSLRSKDALSQQKTFLALVRRVYVVSHVYCILSIQFEMLQLPWELYTNITNMSNGS